MGFLNDHFPRVNSRVGDRQADASADPGRTARRGRGSACSSIASESYIPSGRLSTLTSRRLTVASAGASIARPLRRRTPATSSQRPRSRPCSTRRPRWASCRSIFSGGEPLLHKDILELIRHAHKLGLLARVNTNGLLLTRERVRELKQAGLSLVGLSLDHADPAEHDRLRGVPGLYEKAMEGVRNLHEAGILCQLQVYVSKETAGQGVRDIIAKGREMGVYRVFAFFAIATGRWEAASDELLTEEQEADLRTLQGTGLYHVELATAHTPCCALEGDLVYVGGTGNVTICPFVPYTFGNVRNGGLAAIWRRRMAKADAPYRGRCPMNLPEGRQMLKQRAAEIAGRKD